MGTFQLLHKQLETFHPLWFLPSSVPLPGPPNDCYLRNGHGDGLFLCFPGLFFFLSPPPGGKRRQRAEGGGNCPFSCKSQEESFLRGAWGVDVSLKSPWERFVLASQRVQ